MKKIIIIAFVLGLAGFKIAGATSGACSTHGGVNCKVISSMNDNAICNDGTVSSVPYNNMLECVDYTPTYCLPPIIGLCTTASDLGKMEMQYYGSNAAYDPNFIQTIALCQSAIITYQTQQKNYTSCLDSQSQPVPTSTVFMPDGIHDYAISLTTNGTCDSRYYQSADECVPLSMLPANASVLPNSQIGWQCNNGYTAINSQCVSPPNATVINGLVYCNSGYVDNTYNQCVPAQTSPNVQVNVIATTTPVIPFQSSTLPIATWNISKNITVGASGTNVVSLQKFLEAKGFLILPLGTTEGYLGSATKKALISFQQSIGLPATGYCGAMTRAAINNPQ